MVDLEWSGVVRAWKSSEDMVWGSSKDAQKASKTCRSHMLIASVRFPPFGFEIPEISSKDAE